MRIIKKWYFGLFLTFNEDKNMIYFIPMIGNIFRTLKWSSFYSTKLTHHRSKWTFSSEKKSLNWLSRFKLLNHVVLLILHNILKTPWTRSISAIPHTLLTHRLKAFQALIPWSLLIPNINPNKSPTVPEVIMINLTCPKPSLSKSNLPKFPVFSLPLRDLISNLLKKLTSMPNQAKTLTQHGNYQLILF